MGEAVLSFLRRQAVRLLALTALVVLYGMTRLPEPSQAEREALASHFHFTRFPLPELAGYPRHTVRAVNPSLQRISAWISSVGAGAALADLDGDGLPNDLCLVDPRIDQVMVAPVPDTGARYAPFALNPDPLRYDPSTMAPMGCLAGDFNEDGLLDILVYYWGRTPILFLRQSPEPASATSLKASDYLPVEVAPGGERWYTNAATLADLDGDGHADLVIGNYFHDGAHILDAKSNNLEDMQHSMSRAYNGGRKHFLLWAGASATSVHFVEAKGVLDDKTEHGWTLAIGAADLDGDGLPELYFANDFGPDHLLHNLSEPGHLRFVKLEGRRTLTTPSSKVLGRDSFKGMGVDFADLNGDGLPDIYVSNIAATYALEESHFVFISTGDIGQMRQGIAPYVDRSEPLGLSRSSWSWDAKLDDFDNDGVPEAMQATGFVKGKVDRWPELQELAMGNDELLRDPRVWPKVQPGDDLSGHSANPFFVRDPQGRYINVARELGLDPPEVSRGIAIADVNGDGALDFVVANQWGTSYFYRNDCPRCGTFLGLHLLLPLTPGAPAQTTERPGHPAADTPGRPAIGAAARVHLPDGRVLVAQVDGGNGHSGKRAPDLHFGLGNLPTDARLQVELSWRDPAGQLHRQTLQLHPGWHTIELGWPDKG